MLYSNTSSTKKIFWLGLACYSVLTILAIVFYQERTIFSDAAFRFYAMIKDDCYAIQAHRFGSYFTQSFLYLPYSLGLSLKTIMISYSVGFVVYKSLIFLLCFKFLKQPALALTLLFTDILMVSETFYWIQSELVEGITFCILYFATLKYLAERKFHWVQLPLLLGMLITLLFFHPLMFILYTFMSLFFLLHTQNRTFKKYLVGGFPFTIVILWVKLQYFKSNYDEGAMNRIQNLIDYFPNYFATPSYYRFWTYLVLDYYLLPLLLLAIIAYYGKHKIWGKLAFVVSFFIGYLTLINITFPYNSSQQFHMESFYMPLSLFLALPFAIDVLPQFSKQRALTVIGLIICCRLLHIGLQHQKFTTCLNWKRNILEKTAHFEHKKLVIDIKNVPADDLMLIWGSAYEFWLLSTITTGETRSIIIYNDRKLVSNWGKMKHKKLFLTEWGANFYKELPKTYFKLQDTTTTYVDYNPQAE